jgi:signal transduction histidine kinase
VAGRRIATSIRDMTATLSAPRTLSRLLRLAALGVAVLLSAALLAVVWTLASRFDAQAQASTRQIVASGVQEIRDANKLVVRDYARWTEAHRAVLERDLDWLAANVGIGAASDGAMDAVLVIAEGLPPALGWANPDAAPMRPEDFATLAEAAVSLAADRALQPYGRPTGGFLPVGDRVFLVAVDWIVPQAAVDGEHDPPAGLLVAAQLIGSDDFATLGERLMVPGLRLRDGPKPEHDSLALEGPVGAVAHVSWPRPQPGRAALVSLAVPLALVLVVTAAALGFGALAASRLAERLERALVTSQAADRTKAEFIATLSHELRTPMNGIVGMLDLLAGTELAPEQAEFVGIALESAETQVALIDRLLQFGQIEAGHVTLSAAPFVPDTLIREVVALSRPAADAKGLALQMSGSGPIDQPLLGDRLAIRQIAVNLIGNAVKFTPSGQVSVHLAVTAGLGVCRLRLLVSDSGPGIAPDDRARIFESFVQLDSSSRRTQGGVGLGLAISQRLARAMGGSLTVADNRPAHLPPVRQATGRAGTAEDGAAGRPSGATFVFEVALDPASALPSPPIGAAA